MELSRDGPWRRERPALGTGGRACVRRVSGRPWSLTFEWARAVRLVPYGTIFSRLESLRAGERRPGQTEHKGLYPSECAVMGKGCSLTAVIFVSREHGGPEWTPMVSSR